MGSWTSRYLLYMAAAGEMGYAEKVSGNFAKIEEVLGTNEDALDTHKTSHDTTTDGDLLVGGDIVVSDPHIIRGKMQSEYVMTPIIPLVDGVAIDISTSNVGGNTQIYQISPGVTISGDIVARVNGGAIQSYLLFIDKNMNLLQKSTNLTTSLTRYTIPAGTTGIYARSYNNGYIILGKFTIS